MKILSLVLAFSLASLLACTSSASEAAPAPPTGPDTVSEIETWPWDSGWLSTGMNPQEKGRYIVGIGSTPSALFVLVNVGLPAHPTTFSIGGLTGQARVLAGSNIGGIAETQQMLDFCAEHKLAPMIEIIPASQINEAHENVVAAKVRYRYVIDAATIAE